MTPQSRFFGSTVPRIAALLLGEFKLRRVLHQVRAETRAQDVPEADVRRIVLVARRAHRLGMQVAHYEELRAILSSWRFFHRWLALLMILLAAVHIGAAVRFAQIDWAALLFWKESGW